MEKGQRVKDIKAGTEVKGIFLASDTRKAQSRIGAPYWSLKLSDATGAIEAKIWPPLAESLDVLKDGVYLEVAGRAGLFRDSLQVVLDACRIISDQASLPVSEFMPSSPRDPEEMWEKLVGHCRREFTYEPWADLIFSVLNDPDIGRDLKTRPAAKSVHQAYAGGLLEHTLNVFELCQAVSSAYPELDRQTLLAGALFHDLGKLRELSGGPGIQYTEVGILMGHIYLGMEILGPFLAKSSLPSGLQDHLRHLILSHHGELAYGAVRVPQTAEAFVLHFADNMDAKIQQCRQLVNGVEEGGFSPRNILLDRMIYRPIRTPEAAMPEGLKDQEEPPLPDDSEIPAEEWEEWTEERWEGEILAFEMDFPGVPKNSFQNDKAPCGADQDPKSRKPRRTSCKGQQCSLLSKA